MAPVVPAPCWASRHLMPGVPSQPVRRQRTPPATRSHPSRSRRGRHTKAVALPAPPSRPRLRSRSRSVRIPSVRIRRRLPLRRNSSEPLLPSLSEDNEGGHATVLPRSSTCNDICSPGILSPSPPKSQEGTATVGGKVERYTDESKVVVSVTVEGCPGPVRALVRLGATVEETIAIVADIYRKEGRCPRLDNGGCGDRAGSLELYHSYFCLQGLNKSDKLGDVGARSFYLRKSGTNPQSSSQAAAGEEVLDGPLGAPALLRGPQSCIVSFLVRRLEKIGRKGRKIWNMLGCIASD